MHGMVALSLGTRMNTQWVQDEHSSVSLYIHIIDRLHGANISCALISVHLKSYLLVCAPERLL